LAFSITDRLREIILLQDSLENYFRHESETTSSIASTWSPSVDLYETGEHICLCADLPGINPEDLKIEAQDHFITIQGRRKFVKKEDEDFMRMERSYGPFQRTFRLPSRIIRESLTVTFKDGVLKIKVRKTTDKQPETARIQVLSSNG
jgi:HSP20 family protein